MIHIKLRHIVDSGHLHGLSAPDLHLEIALEPDALHRETQRRLSISTGVSTGDHTQPLILERGYTATGQVDHLALRSPHSASEQHYQYDALCRMLFRSQHAQGQGQGHSHTSSPTIAYNYDAAGRLIGSQHGHDAHRYPVDAAGNRSAASSFTPNATNQLAQLNGTRYRYDGAGNLVHREHPGGERLTLGYDGANRLVQLTHISKLGYTRHAHYRYDGLGRRINKTVSHTDGTTATTHYGWDGDHIVREETNNQRTTVVYEPGSFVPMLRIDQSNGNEEKHLSAYVTDALGTPLQLLSPNGQPRWLAEPDDWAAVTKQRAVRNLTQPIRFQGQWHDEESGLYYNRHRYYDPEQGRYISQDPIGLRGGTNLYGYVTNPTGMVDPLGLEGDIPWRYRIDRDVHPIRNVPKMFMQYVHDMVIPEKETAEAISNVAAVCSLAPPLTGVCGATSIGAGIYAAGTEAADGNYHQARLDVAPIIASEATDLIFKRATLATDAVSNAIGVATGFKSQYWINRDNYIDHEGECQHAEE